MRFSQAQLKHPGLTPVLCEARRSEQNGDAVVRIFTQTNPWKQNLHERLLFRFPIKLKNKVTDSLQIECARAVCIFHFAACVISCSPFTVTEETEEKQCIHIALGSRRLGRSIINQRSTNTAHNVNLVLIFKAVDTCNEQSISTKYFCKVQKDAMPGYVLNYPLVGEKGALAEFPPFQSAYFLPTRNMKHEFCIP